MGTDEWCERDASSAHNLYNFQLVPDTLKLSNIIEEWSAPETETSVPPLAAEPESPSSVPDSPTMPISLSVVGGSPGGMPPILSSLATACPTINMSPPSACQESLTVIQPCYTQQRTMTSYVEVVHRDAVFNFNGSCAITKLVTTLTEWLVVLQGIAEDRESDKPPVKCRCGKATKIDLELKSLSKKLSDAEQLSERVGMVPEEDIDTISRDVVRIASLLRSDVSILIPTAIGRADPVVAEQAKLLVQDIESRRSVGEAIEGIVGLVFRLLGVEQCAICNSQDCEDDEMAQEIDPEIRCLVAGMCGDDQLDLSLKTSGLDSISLKDIGRDVLEKSRKRKQIRPARVGGAASSILPPCGPPQRKCRKMESPRKSGGTVPWLFSQRHQQADQDDEDEEEEEEEEEVVRPPAVVTLLEKKKKQVKKDGLYKFVLWREALKDEKAKITSD